MLHALAANTPSELRGRTDAELARIWPAWVEQHDRDIRARLARGDEDSLVNLWLYGTSFTSHPPALAGSGMSAQAFEALARARLDDLLAQAAVATDNQRLRFVRALLAARGADPVSATGRERARTLLTAARQRMVNEFAAAERTLSAARGDGAGSLAGANATIFRSRGLSSDTSLLADYGVHVALETMARQHVIAAGSVRRVAIVGPGLDFTNKADGYDYYPEQILQPFAVVDALRRAGLAAPDLRVTTFDINTRVNAHLEQVTATSPPYVVALVLDAGEPWTTDVLGYWARWGETIGAEVRAPAPPAAAGPVRARAVRIEPAVAASIVPRDVNIVVDRLTLTEEERFDLVVATNVLVYYDVFEQALAAANVASMLRPGGVFLTNTAVFPSAPLRPSASYLRVVHTTTRYDDLYWYQREH